MSFKIVLVAILVLTTNAHGTELLMRNFCTGKTVLVKELPSEGLTVAELTSEALSNGSLDYSLTEQGLGSFQKSPQGLDGLKQSVEMPSRSTDGATASMVLSTLTNRPTSTSSRERKASSHGFMVTLSNNGVWKNMCNFNPRFANPTMCKPKNK